VEVLFESQKTKLTDVNEMAKERDVVENYNYHFEEREQEV